MFWFVVWLCEWMRARRLSFIRPFVYECMQIFNAMGLLSVSFWVRVFHFAFVRSTLKATFNQQFYLFWFGFGGFFNMRLVILLFHLTCAWSKIKSKHFKLSNLYHCTVDCSSFALKFNGNLFGIFFHLTYAKDMCEIFARVPYCRFFYVHSIHYKLEYKPLRKKNYWKIEI